MFENLFKQIPKNVKKVAIYGAGTCASAIKKELNEFNKEIKIAYYIDLNKVEDDELSPIIKPYLLPEIKNEIDLIIISIKNPCDIVAILKLYDIPYITMPYEADYKIKTASFEEDIPKVLDIFKYNEDKELYKLVWEARRTRDFTKIEQYVKERHNINKNSFTRNYNHQYLEYINKNAIKSIIDCGFCNGIHAFGFKKHLPNLKKDWAFEPLYDLFKVESYDILLKQLNFVEIIPYGAWDKDETLDIAINGSASAITNIKPNQKHAKRQIKTTAIDKVCEKYKIESVDFIKMDIEGSEFNALRGGGSTILKNRPQLAISIYHSNDDFINIPLYLSKTLKNYVFRLGHYSYNHCETVLYAIPEELKD